MTPIEIVCALLIVMLISLKVVDILFRGKIEKANAEFSYWEGYVDATLKITDQIGSCKECEHRGKYTFCPMIDKNDDKNIDYIKEDGYCSYFKRKHEEEHEEYNNG